MLAVVVKDNVVVNQIVADAALDAAPEGCSLVNIADGLVAPIGSAYDPVTGAFTPPPPPPEAAYVPESITPCQCRLYLLQIGMLANVEAMIAQQDEATKIAWEYSSKFRRDNPLLLSLAEKLGLMEKQIDQFFIAAAEL